MKILRFLSNFPSSVHCSLEKNSGAHTGRLQLQSHWLLDYCKHNEFDRICFSFPHCKGKKSNIRYNRLTQLLWNFELQVSRSATRSCIIYHERQQFPAVTLSRSDGVHSGQSSMTKNSATANRQDDHTGSAKEPVSGAHQQQYEDTNGIHNYEAAAAAGHARANSNKVVDNYVERLIAACGYGQIHVLHVSTTPHHILGRNVCNCRTP